MIIVILPAAHGLSFLTPKKSKWEPLPAPPNDHCIKHARGQAFEPVVYGCPGEGKKIFLSCCRYIYHVDAQTWEKFTRPETVRPFTNNLTGTDGSNILYWTSFGHLYSLDMKTRDVGCGFVEDYNLSKYSASFEG